MSQFSDGTQRKYCLFKTLRAFSREQMEPAEQGDNQSFCQRQVMMKSATTTKRKLKKSNAYILGGFSTSVVTDNIENTRSYYEHETLEINRNHNDIEVLILFIDGRSIPMIINQISTVLLFYTP